MPITGLAGQEPAPQENYVQSNFGGLKFRHTSAAAGLSEMKIAIAQPPCQGGPSEVFRIVDDQYVHQTRNSATESIPASLRPFWSHKWAVTPKLTMIDGRQLSIGKLSV
jgi:hypothetical protein